MNGYENKSATKTIAPPPPPEDWMVATLRKHSALDVHGDGLGDALRELECDLVTLENLMSDFNKCQ